MESKGEQPFLHMTHLDMIHNHTKTYKNISKGMKVME